MSNEKKPFSELHTRVLQEEADLASLTKELVEENYVAVGKISGNGLDISKFLREDKSISLELLEFAVQYLVSFTTTINIWGWEKYFEIRMSQAQATEEMNFVLRFCRAVAEEETGTIIRVVALSSPGGAW